MTHDRPNGDDLSIESRAIADGLGFKFEAGLVVAGRFHLLRELGRGGMGVVYEAQDQMLDRRVALKCSKPGHRDHLPGEVRAAREVSHFNVCKVYDLHSVSTPEGDVEFLSMEFIQGETLSARLRNGGPLAPKEALSIARQICAGVTQAHKQDVIHGDLKTGNILLSKLSDGTVRAVVTDFGLARFDRSGGHGGTREYMAPELLLGNRSTPASDIYALGILFHNLLTGHSPKKLSRQKHKPSGPDEPVGRSKEDETATMAAVIRESDWERNIAGLPPLWKKVVARCIAPKPEKRFPSAEAVAHALSPRRTLLKAAVVIAALASIALGYWQWKTLPIGPPVRLVILPFSGDAKVLNESRGVDLEVADRLTGARRNFSVISPREARQNQVDSAPLARRVLGATHALRTELTDSNEGIVATASLIDIESSRIVRTLNGTYPPKDLAILGRALVGTVTSEFHLKPRTASDSVNDSAYADYVAATELMRRDNNNFDEAISHLNQAVRLDPLSALPYAALADALIEKFLKGDTRELLDKASNAVGKAKSISPDSVQVLLAEGKLDRARGRYEQAAAALTRATELAPGNAMTWQQLAKAYEAATRNEEAVATYRKAIAAQPEGYGPYFDFGLYYLLRGQYPQAEELFRKVTVMAPGLPNGHVNLGLSFFQEGRLPAAEKELQASLRLRKTASGLTNLGATYYGEKKFDLALSIFEELLSLSAPTAARYRNLGDAYRHLQRSKEAETAYRKALTLTEQEVTGNPRNGPSRARLAYLAAYLGDKRTAEFEASQALASEPENVTVLRESAKTYEALKQRDRTLELLKNAPKSLLEELNRQPDVEELRLDLRFQELLKSKSNQ